MEPQKDGLEIRMDTELWKFRDILHKARQAGQLQNERVLKRTMGMLNYLDDDNNTNKFVTRKIHTVGELYSFKEDEIRRFGQYKKKTWLKLNEILTGYGLPPLKLPQEYTVGQ